MLTYIHWLLRLFDLFCRYSRSIREFLDEAFEQHERQERQQVVAQLPTRDGSGDGLDHNADQPRVALERALAQLEEEEELVRNAMRAQGTSPPENEPSEGSTGSTATATAPEKQ